MGRHAAPKQKYKKKISPLIKGRSRNGKSIIPDPKVIEEMMKERMRRRVEEQEKSIQDVRETTEDVESKGPMGYGGFSTNYCNNDSSSDGGSGSSDNGSDYASSECVSDYDSEFDSGSSSDDESDSENEQNAINKISELSFGMSTMFCQSETIDPIFSNIVCTPETNFLSIFQYQPSYVLMDYEDVEMDDVSEFKTDEFIADDDIEMIDLSDDYYAHVNAIDEDLPSNRYCNGRHVPSRNKKNSVLVMLPVVSYTFFFFFFFFNTLERDFLTYY